MPTSIDYNEYLIKTLKDRKEAVGYLNACLQDPDPRVFASALREVARAQGGTKAEKASKLLPRRGVPDLHELGAVLSSLGLRLTVEKNRTA